MPSRNVVKYYDSNTYYHVYNRGVDKRDIFLDDEDYAVFLNLLKRYLCDKPQKDNKGREYRSFADQTELIAFCLMQNHFHLLLYQIEADAITSLIRSVCSTYTTYFNKKHHRVGPLFQGIFKASKINSESYLLHTTRYIHRNPAEYLKYKWSSLDYWLERKRSSWLKTKRVNDFTPEKYLDFIKDEEDYSFSKDFISNEFDES